MPKRKPTREVREYLRKQAARGGKAAAAKMSPQQRVDRAKKGAKARWKIK